MKRPHDPTEEEFLESVKVKAVDPDLQVIDFTEAKKLYPLAYDKFSKDAHIRRKRGQRWYTFPKSYFPAGKDTTLQQHPVEFTNLMAEAIDADSDLDLDESEVKEFLETQTKKSESKPELSNFIPINGTGGGIVGMWSDLLNKKSEYVRKITEPTPGVKPDNIIFFDLESQYEEINKFLPPPSYSGSIDHFTREYTKIIISLTIELADEDEDLHVVLLVFDNITKRCTIFDSSGVLSYEAAKYSSDRATTWDQYLFTHLDYLSYEHATKAEEKEEEKQQIQASLRIQNFTKYYQGIFYTHLGQYQNLPMYDGDCAVFAMWFMLWFLFNRWSIQTPPPMPLHEPLAMRNYIVMCLLKKSIFLPPEIVPYLDNTSTLSADEVYKGYPQLAF